MPGEQKRHPTYGEGETGDRRRERCRDVFLKNVWKVLRARETGITSDKGDQSRNGLAGEETSPLSYVLFICVLVNTSKNQFYANKELIRAKTSSGR